MNYNHETIACNSYSYCVTYIFNWIKVSRILLHCVLFFHVMSNCDLFVYLFWTKNYNVVFIKKVMYYPLYLL